MSYGKYKYVVIPIALTAALGAAISAQPQQPVWVPLDSSPAGTPPSVVLDQQASSSNLTVLDITIHGFYREPVVEQGTAFERISLPDSRAERSDPGRPAVPQVPLQLGIATDAATASVTVARSGGARTFRGIRVYPAQPDVVELPNGAHQSPPFTYDANFYATRQQLYPVNLARITGQPGSWRGVRVQSGFVHAFQARPATNDLIVHQRLHVEITHAGTEVASIPISQRDQGAFRELINRLILERLFATDPILYHGRYLVISDAILEDELTPFMRQKFERGFYVTYLSTATTGNTATQIHSAIISWYASVPPGSDAYVLLVGDVDSIPLHTDPWYGYPSDHYYACLDGDIYPEVGLGRLSVDDEADCDDQVQKILRYEDTPPVSASFYDSVTLAAHKGEAGVYVDAMQDVADYPGYYHQPTFSERFGDTPSGTTGNVLADIDTGRAVVVYRGHGSYAAWSSWDYNGTSLDGNGDVTGLANDPLNPVVFAICCQNNAIDTVDDSIGELWMEDRNHRAVAHHGAIRNSYRTPNHEFARQIMRSLYDIWTPTLSGAITNAWFTARWVLDGSTSCEKNIAMYSLLGDPEMKVLQQSPYVIFVSNAPPTLSTLPQTIDFTVVDPGNIPVPGAVVALYKPGEVLVNRITDINGGVSIPLPPTTAGKLALRVWHDDVRVVGQRVELDIVAPLPDLQVASVAIDDLTPARGAKVIVNAMVRNDGGAAAAASTVSLHLKAHSGPVEPARDFPLGTINVPALGAGAWVMVTAAVKVPSSIAPHLSWSVHAEADPGGAIAESEETNNGGDTRVRPQWPSAPGFYIGQGTTSLSSDDSTATFGLYTKKVGAPAGESYYFLWTCSGTSPGLPLPGLGTLPLNIDPCTQVGLALEGVFLFGSRGPVLAGVTGGHVVGGPWLKPIAGATTHFAAVYVTAAGELRISTDSVSMSVR